MPEDMKKKVDDKKVKKDKNQSQKQGRKSSEKMSIGSFFGRYHAIMFFVIVFGGLSVEVYMLNGVITSSATPADYTPPTTDTSFDTRTIEQVEALRPLSEPPTPPEIPPGRTDPFPQ
jgi:hypothetical protein